MPVHRGRVDAPDGRPRLLPQGVGLRLHRPRLARRVARRGAPGREGPRRVRRELEDFLDDGCGAAAAAVATAVGKKRCDHLLLLCVHSHARLVGRASVASMTARFGGVPASLVSLPCCPRFRSRRDVGRAPDVSYEDDCVFSACRRVEVWNFD